MDGETIRRWRWWKAALLLLALVGALVAIPVVAVVALLAYDDASFRRFLARTPFVADLGGPTNEDEERHFAERAERAFPIGSRVDVLRRTLAEQGFSALPAYGGFQNRLHVESGRFPCGVAWDVLWSAERGTIMAIAGDMRLTCL